MRRRHDTDFDYICKVGLILLLGFLFFNNVVSVNSTQTNPRFIGLFTSSDKAKLGNFFLENISDTSIEPQNLYFKVLGLHNIGTNIPDSKKLCALLNKPNHSPDYAFYNTITSKLLNGACVVYKDLNKLLKEKLNDEINAENLFYLVSAANSAGIKVDTDLVIQLVPKIKNKDSNPNTMGYLIQVISQLGLTKTALKTYMQYIYDLLDKAIELDNNQLFFERGVYTSALAAKGLVDYINAINEVPSGVDSKLVKLFNYLYFLRETKNLRASTHIIQAFKTLADSSFLFPVVLVYDNLPLGLYDLIVLNDQIKPRMEFQLKHFWNDSFVNLNDLNLNVGILTKQNHPGLDAVPLAKISSNLIKLGKSNTDQSSMIELILNDGKNLDHGYYRIEFSVKSPNNDKLIGLTESTINLHILTELKIMEASVLIKGADEMQLNLIPGQLYKSSESDGVIVLDYDDQIQWFFKLTNSLSNGQPFRAHQTFIQLTHTVTGQMTTIINQETGNKLDLGNCHFQLMLSSSADDFDNLDGIYRVEFMIGDPLLNKPLIWHMMNVQLKFNGIAGSESKRAQDYMMDSSTRRTWSTAGSKLARPFDQIVSKGPLNIQPEIDHQFREPDKRASRFIALLFTGICLSPLAILIIGWFSVGFNISNFKIRFVDILFQIGLVSIFYLYYIYWIRLDMFTTLGYLTLLGLITFLAGNFVLHNRVMMNKHLKK